MHTLAVAASWFFIAVSLVHVAVAVAVQWGDPSGTFKLYHAVVDDRSYDAWGLTYTGTPGLLLAMAQALLVASAAVASTLRAEAAGRYRRAGHALLVAWSALWALNLLWLAGVDPAVDSIAQAGLACVLAACTAYRALTGWSRS